MTTPFIVGFGHVARVGKDSAAAALCRDLGFHRYGFADQLRELAVKADPLVTASTRSVNVNIGHGRLAWTVQGMGWEAAKDSYTEVRRFLQNLGQGARQVFGEDFWVDRLMDRVAKADAGRIVIPDVRHTNEAEAIQAAGGVVFRIDRPGHAAKGHVSETELLEWDGWDRTFLNDKSVAEMQVEVVEYVRSLLEPAKKLSARA